MSSDTTELRVTGVSMYFDGLVHGLAAYARHGHYSDGPVEEARALVAAALVKPDARRGQRVQAIVQRALYGDGHPYARAVESTPASIRSIGRGDLERFRARYYTPRNAVLVIGGRFDPDLMAAHVRHAFAGWSSDQPAAQPVDQPARPRPLRFGFDDEDESQVEVWLAHPTAAGLDDGYPARQVLIEMLRARLAAVRERLGASYGVGVRQQLRSGPGIIEISGAIDAARGGEGLGAVRDAVAGLRQVDAAFASDFVTARRVVAQRLLADATDSTSLADDLIKIARFHRGQRWVAGLADQVARLTPADVAALAQRELDPDQETLVVMGARKAVEAAFAGAGLPPPKFAR